MCFNPLFLGLCFYEAKPNLIRHSDDQNTLPEKWNYQSQDEPETGGRVGSTGRQLLQMPFAETAKCNQQTEKMAKFCQPW